MEDFEKAIFYASQIEQYYEKGVREIVKIKAYEILWNSYKALGNFQLALQAYEKYTALKEDMFNLETQNKINECLLAAVCQCCHFLEKWIHATVRMLLITVDKLLLHSFCHFSYEQPGCLCC